MTKEELQELLYNYRKYQISTEYLFKNSYVFHMFPRIICNDGFQFLAQTHRNYSYLAYWESMELYGPYKEEQLLNDYLSSDRPLKDIYTGVPMQVIVDVINKHGGMKNIEDFRGY